MAAEIVVRIGNDGLIGRARALANDESLSIREWGTDHLKESLHFLVEKLENLQALLPDAERQAESSRAVLDWLKRLVAIVFKADNRLSRCAYDVAQLKAEIDNKRNKVRNFFSFTNPSLLALKIACSIEETSSRIERVCREGHFMGLEKSIQSVDRSAIVLGDTEVSVLNKLQSLWEPEDLEGIRESLISTENDEDLRVISIVGMGGIGKTTLAWRMYEDFDVSSYFDEKMWVSVSENFNAGKILTLMLQSLTRTTRKQSSRDAIVPELTKRLKGKRYLLILDNVWNKTYLSNEWSSLKDCLLRLSGSKESKIMVTSRTQAVGSEMSSERRYLYFPRLKREEECWSLFAKIAFPQSGGAPETQEWEEIGKRIANKCGGHPLAVKLIASLMYSKKKKEEWLKLDDAISRLRLLSNSVMLDDTSSNSRSLNNRFIISLMKFCYDHLPSLAIRQCFAYCSIFPKGTIRERLELVQLWMAQGYLTPPKAIGLTMEEDVGARYLDILLQRRFLQDASEDEDDNKTLCKMHNVLHDLALLLARPYCSILENENVKDDFEATHVSLIRCKVELSKGLRKRFAKLRTLRLVGTSINLGLGELLTCSTSLHALILVDLQLEDLPSSIGKLKHLRYLDISNTRVIRLPDSITNLYNLQTLRLYDFDKIPKNFENLVSLRHIHVENSEDLAKRNLLPSKFQELINRPSFKACLGGDCPVDTLEKLEKSDRYSSLKICRLEKVDNGEDSRKAILTVSKLSKIESLKLHWNARRENSYDEEVLKHLQPHSKLRHLTIENFKGSKFPSWTEGELSNLEKIDLEGCSSCKEIPPLGHLLRLKTVRIVGLDSVVRIGPEFYGSNSDALFPALTEFYLKHMASLEEWSDASQQYLHAFPLLQRLEVKRCSKLTGLPDLLNRGCKKIRHLEIAFCNKLIHLPEILRRHQFLEELEIRGLPSVHEKLIGPSNKLKSLTIGCFFSDSEENYNSKGLPENLRYLSNLRNLTIWGYDELEELPEWLGNLISLQVLKLELCRKLKSLPSDALRQLPRLAELNICLCPVLEERCIRGSRPEWPKISHIPTIEISYEIIQSPK